MAKITIDGQEYDTENFSDEARKQLAAIQFLDRKIMELQTEVAALQTARSSYGKALLQQLPKDDSDKEEKSE